jgi:hypothetical protein
MDRQICASIVLYSLITISWNYQDVEMGKPSASNRGQEFCSPKDPRPTIPVQSRFSSISSGPDPRLDTASAGFRRWHTFSDKHPQPIQLSS